MKKKRPPPSKEDWELCRRYIAEMTRKGLVAHEPWERELEAWAADPDRYPRGSTVSKLRIRFLEDP
jgi:hypothetical protein